MRTLTTTVLATVAAFLLLPGPVAAQEEMPQAEKHENVTWYEIVHIEFESGSDSEALELIRDHFVPAYREAEVPGPQMAMVHETGEWDLTLVWHLQDGPSAFEWDTSPQEVEVQKAFIQQVGKEKAQELSEQYESYVSRTKVILTYQDPTLVPEQ